jgi:V/A-type H+/Na+-transporting ATPase subunit I
MARVRVLGPRAQLADVVRELQDVGLLHLAEPRPNVELHPHVLTPRQERHAKYMRRMLEDLHVALGLLETGLSPRLSQDVMHPSVERLAEWAKLAQRVRRELVRLDSEQRSLEEERQLLEKYRHLFSAFEPLLNRDRPTAHFQQYYLMLSAGREQAVTELRAGLQRLMGSGFELFAQPIPTGETAILLLVPRTAVDQVDGLLQAADVQELQVPGEYQRHSVGDAIKAMRTRLEAIPDALQVLAEQRAALRTRRSELEVMRASVHDSLLELSAASRAAVTQRAFVLEGWLPAQAIASVESRLLKRFGQEVVVEHVATEEWSRADAPVVLSNPRLFRPFEAITRMVPLPRYGTIDPTPFVAIFFPMFYGVVLGDIGYGLLLAGVALVIRWRTTPDSLLRSVAEIAGACALFAVVFGVVYGEFLGDLGHRWFGLKPVVFGREEAFVPFLALAVALGVVHVLLGLSLSVISSFRQGSRREVVGRGAATIMVVLIVIALLAAVEVLPPKLLTPSAVGVLIAFPILVIAEGLIGAIELLSTLGNILSYARIMAVGTASVMMAVVANRMVGAVGSIAVGLLFALLFHLVNFALGVFSPTIHMLRLHYVEFFGKFYSPGGTQYQPFGHWHADGVRAR